MSRGAGRIALAFGLALLLLGAPAFTQPTPDAVTPVDVAPFERLHTIVLDPGHGGTDGGCVGAAGVPEKFLTLKISRRLARALVGRVDRVVMTRSDDGYPTLEERTHLANMEQADALLSLHFNCALNVEAQGIETFYLHPDGTVPGDVVPGMEPEGDSQLWVDLGVAGELPALIAGDLTRAGATWVSGALAEHLQTALIASTGMEDRGVRQAQFRVLRGALTPAVVVELGFLTHAREGKQLLTSERLDALVAGLVAGLTAYDHWMVESR